MTYSRDAELQRLAAIVVDTDEGENPFAWRELPPPRPQAPEAAVEAGA